MTISCSGETLSAFDFSNIIGIKLLDPRNVSNGRRLWDRKRQLIALSKNAAKEFLSFWPSTTSTIHIVIIYYISRVIGGEIVLNQFIKTKTFVGALEITIDGLK